MNIVTIDDVKKTRVYVCTNEDDAGKLVVETWIISKHVKFSEL